MSVSFSVKRRMAKIASTILSVLLVCGCVFGCASADSTRDFESRQMQAGVRASSPAEVWYAPGTQKIRSDIGKSAYADIVRTSVNVQMGKAEYESAQIIMSAIEDIGAYELTVSDLSLQGNESVKFSANNVTVYNQRYINVTVVREVSPGSTPGWYPDALVPFAGAKKYGENKVKQGTNQGLWVTFSAPEDCTPGTYTGEFTLTMDGYEHKVPVTLTVRDYDFAKNHTAQNCFLMDWTSFAYAELDSSQEMYDAYAKALLEYRLQPGLLMNDYLRSDPDDILYYTDRAFELAQDPRCSVVFLPFDVTNSDNTYLLKDTSKAYLKAFADKSLASYGTDTQLNLVGKTRSYFTFIDEPTMNPALIPRVNRAMKDFAEVRMDVKNELQAELDAAKEGMTEDEIEFKQAVINDILKVRDIVTGPHDDRMTGVEIYCPLIDEYDNEKNREEYAEDVERWWYTAVGPRYPYPGYHIDNTSLLSARLISWMQSEYDVVGNLYWATNLYNAYSVEEFIEDPYDFPRRYSFAGGANGDGFLFYPGKRYDVFGPVGSIRLQAIRDGLEEYEVLRAVKEIYAGIDEAIGSGGNEHNVRVNFSDVYKRMSENLYSGTSVYTTQDYFDEAQDLLGNLGELAAMGGAVASVENKEGSAKVKIIVPRGITVTYETGGDEGKSIVKHEFAQTGDNAAYDMFEITQPILSSNNVFVCSVASAEKTIDLRINLGGAVTERNAAQMRENLQTGVGELTVPTAADMVKANTVDTSITDTETEWLQLKLPDATVQRRQTLLITDAELLGQIGSGTQKLVLSFYNNRDTSGKDEGKYTFRLQFKYANSEYYTEIRQDQLKGGYNVITVGNMFGYDWENLGALTEIRVFFGETESEKTNDVYFIGAQVYAL